MRRVGGVGHRQRLFRRLGDEGVERARASIACTKAPVSSLEEIFLARSASRASAKVMADQDQTLFDHLRHDEEMVFAFRRVRHQGVGVAAVGDLVLAPSSASGPPRWSWRGTPSTLTSPSISTHWKMPLSSPAMGSSAAFRHGQPGQFGDAAHGVLVDGHEGSCCVR